tara:strand:- start:1637 stop:1837 length:201 start_codon:yes stop_codon:yes gene_type:complete
MKINTKDTDINNIMQAVSFALVSAREHKTGSFWGVNEDSWRKHLEDLARIKLELKTGAEVILKNSE